MTPSYTHVEGLYDSEYFDIGSGPLLIFIHGIGSSCESFIDQIELFKSGYRAISWGLPGYGASSPLDCERPEVEDYIERLRQFIDWMRLDKFHLVGHSLGALIGAGFAAKHPERLLSLSLCSVPQGYGGEPVAVQAEHLLNRIYDLCVLGPAGMAERRGPRLFTSRASPAAVKCVVTNMAKVRYDGYTQAAHLLSKTDVKKYALQIPDWLPVFLCVGSQDQITPPSDSEAISKCLPGVRYEVLEGVGHASYLEDPREFFLRLQAFIETAGTTRAA
jgi:pimeloyl-ACP methyl ester carboxylesterase